MYNEYEGDKKQSNLFSSAWCISKLHQRPQEDVITETKGIIEAKVWAKQENYAGNLLVATE